MAESSNGTGSGTVAPAAQPAAPVGVALAVAHLRPTSAVSRLTVAEATRVSLNPRVEAAGEAEARRITTLDASRLDGSKYRTENFND